MILYWFPNVDSSLPNEAITYDLVRLIGYCDIGLSVGLFTYIYLRIHIYVLVSHLYHRPKMPSYTLRSGFWVTSLISM